MAIPLPKYKQQVRVSGESVAQTIDPSATIRAAGAGDELMAQIITDAGGVASDYFKKKQEIQDDVDRANYTKDFLKFQTELVEKTNQALMNEENPLKKSDIVKFQSNELNNFKNNYFNDPEKNISPLVKKELEFNFNTDSSKLLLNATTTTQRFILNDYLISLRDSMWAAGATGNTEQEDLFFNRIVDIAGAEKASEFKNEGFLKTEQLKIKNMNLDEVNEYDTSKIINPSTLANIEVSLFNREKEIVKEETDAFLGTSSQIQSDAEDGFVNYFALEAARQLDPDAPRVKQSDWFAAFIGSSIDKPKEVKEEEDQIDLYREGKIPFQKAFNGIIKNTSISVPTKGKLIAELNDVAEIVGVTSIRTVTSDGSGYRNNLEKKLFTDLKNNYEVAFSLAPSEESLNELYKNYNEDREALVTFLSPLRPSKFSQVDKVAGIDEETYLKNKDRFLERSQNFALRSDAIFNPQKEPTQEDIDNLKSGETIIINGQLYRKP